MARGIAGLAIALGALMLAPGVGATVVSGSFTGVMDGGTDTFGYFGAAGFNVFGRIVTGTFHYDTASFGNDTCPVVLSEGCFMGPGITVTETIAGTGSFTFHGTSPLIPGGLVLYGGFPASTSGADEYTLQSSDGTVSGNVSTENSTTLGLSSTTNDFIPNFQDPASVFSLSNADLNPNSIGNINLTSLGSEQLTFRFTDPSSNATATTGGSTPVPEPASLLLFSFGLLGLAMVRRRNASA